MKKIFTVASLSKGLTHFGSETKIPICGTKMYNPELTDTEIQFIDGQLREHWVSEVQGNKWVKVAEYEYCKTCLKILKKRILNPPSYAKN